LNDKESILLNIFLDFSHFKIHEYVLDFHVLMISEFSIINAIECCYESDHLNIHELFTQ